MIGRPTVTVTVDGRELTGPEAALISVSVSIERGRGVDGAIVSLGQASPVAATGPGTPVEISLGYGGEDTTVLTGEVDRAAQHPWGVQLLVHALPARLHRLRVGRSYLDQAPADIVADLASAADVDTGRLEGNEKLAAYYVDERRPAWRHASDLARLAGASLSTSADGALEMVAVASGGASGLAAAAATAASAIGLSGPGWRYGAELLDGVVTPARSTAVPKIVPSSAASTGGAAKWHLLLREPDGGAPSAQTLIPTSVRTKGTAETLEASLAAASARRGTTAEVVVLGRPDARPGDPVTIADWPSGDPTALEVAAVRHRFSEDGFVSLVELEAAA